MVFMELVYMVLNSDANWLNNSDECYKLNAITVMQEQREDWIIIVIKKCSVEIWHSGINESKIFIQCNLAQIIVQNIDMQTQNSPLLSQIAKYLSVECLELWNNLRGGGVLHYYRCFVEFTFDSSRDQEIGSLTTNHPVVAYS